MKSGELRLKKCSAAIISLLLFISCATVPRTGPPPEDGSPDFSVLPPGAQFYLWADINSARPILEALPLFEMGGMDTSDNRAASQILDRTDTVLAAVYPEDAGKRFFVAGWGNYPNVRAGVSMSFSRGWRRVRSQTGSRYWYSRDQNIGVALGSSLAFVSDGDPFTPAAGSCPAPRDFPEFHRDMVLAGWAADSAGSINRSLDVLGIPIQIPAEDLIFGVARIPHVPAPAAVYPEIWEFVMRFRFQSPFHARSLLALFTQVRNFTQRAAAGSQFSGDFLSPQEFAALLFANQPQLDNDSVILRTDPLTANRIALLSYLFTVLSN